MPKIKIRVETESDDGPQLDEVVVETGSYLSARKLAMVTVGAEDLGEALSELVANYTKRKRELESRELWGLPSRKGNE